MKYNVKKALQQYLPSFLILLNEQNISWTSINNGLEKHLETLKIKIDDNQQNKIEKEVTFYSLLVNHVTGSEKGKAMFDFNNKIFIQLSNSLSLEEKKPIHKMLSGVLQNFDKNYLNFIGELATLNLLIKTGNYELLNIEEKIHPDRNISADLFLRSKDDKKEFLIEILNIHLEDIEFDNNDSLRFHLESKLKKKKDNKFINPNRIIFIQPVIWIKNFEQLKKICDLYNIYGFAVENVLLPVSYVSFLNTDGSFEHRFENLKTILES